MTELRTRRRIGAKLDPVSETNPLPTSIEWGSVSITSLVVLRQDAFTRPANTTAYAARDEMSNSATAASVVPLKFSNIARPGVWSGTILDLLLLDSTAEATAPAPELWLFSAPPTAAGDNVALAFTDQDMTERLIDVIPFNVGYVGLPGTGGNMAFPIRGHNKTYKLQDKDLYGMLVSPAAYTPVSGEIYTVKIWFQVD